MKLFWKNYTETLQKAKKKEIFDFSHFFYIILQK